MHRRSSQRFGWARDWGSAAPETAIALQLQSAAPPGRHGLYGMVPQLGGPTGFCVAASLFFVLTGFVTEAEFLSFSWRFAFFGVLAVNVVSLFARLRMLTESFGLETPAIRSAPALVLFREQ